MAVSCTFDGHQNPDGAGYCSKCGKPLATTGAPPDPGDGGHAGARPIVRGPGEGLARANGVGRWLAVGSETGGTLTCFETRVLMGRGPVLHVHRDADEAFYVLEGEIDFTVAGWTHRETAGTFLFVPRGTEHRFQGASEAPARLLTIFTPSGFELWSEAITPLARAGAGPDELSAVDEQYGHPHQRQPVAGG